MSTSHHRPADSWSPLYFLASVGAGGLSVTSFMFLMFWVPHPDQPVPVFENILTAFVNGALPLKVAILIAATGIAGFSVLNIKHLIWNLARLGEFKQKDSYAQLVNSSGKTQLLAMPFDVPLVS